jgi:NADH:ubiquinone reductase (H+-translocating)
MSVKFENLPYPTVIVIGGGFGGLEIAKGLARKKYKVLVLDKNNYHTFQPLLYQVATGGLGSDNIAYPLRKIIGPMPNVAFRMAEVVQINQSTQQVITNVGEFRYDYLILASGSATNYFGNIDFQNFSMPLKSIPEALDLRSEFLQEFEKALVQQSLEHQKRALNFVIVGAGPTGVELAGAMAEIKKHVMPKDYQELSPELMEINLVEAGPRVLSAMSEKSSKNAQEYLEKLGVKVFTNTKVVSFQNGHLSLESGATMKTDTVIWTAGVKAISPEGFLVDQKLKSGRIKVDAYNRVENSSHIFAIGDVAGMQSEDYPNGHPMVAPVAIQQAQHLVKNLIKLSNGISMEPFKYKDKGSMATIGRNKAVVDLPNLHISGWFAWYVWMFIHLVMLVSFRNRIIVFINWAWNYISYDRAIRLIIRPFKGRSVT